MLSRFFRKGNRFSGGTASDAADTRGLEVVEEDPDTAWGKWDDAVAEQESCFADTGRSELNTAEADTTPAALASWQSRDELERAQRRDHALSVVDLHHQRIANTIRTMWGHKECSIYINKLIMAGGDGMGKARVGFNQEAAEAMLVLADLHDTEFGSPPIAPGTVF